ncbi:T9SS type A sorting domain-containing protein [Brumimicrobium oceani]|nr:T9SS type A sorting domain-containing protein [Brumimicrobium oceani]
MKYIQLLLFSFLATVVLGQDGLSPLTANPDLFHKEKIETKALQNSFDSTFIYKTDTLTLPFFDDFSRNKFQQYDAGFSDPNVTEELFYRMLDENTNVPLPPSTVLTNTRTYRLIYDAVTEETTYDYLDSVRFLFDDLSVYAPNHIQTYAFPGYIIYDTLDGSGNLEDTIWVNNPEYVQDSARIFVASINNPEKLWLDDQAYHNYRFAVNPWSLGVVTFDGLDAFGYPYNFSTSTNGIADLLTAKPLDLSGNSPADSVYFSFLYQKEGFGDVPEESSSTSDSLFLEFYSPVDQLWKRVWRTGPGETTDFQVAHIAVKDPIYFQKGFQFRFSNYGALAGALDHFHIDYVDVRTLSGYQDTLFKDFAIVYPISSLIEDYISVPWKHYRNNPAGKMSSAVDVTVRNGSELTENNQNGSVNIYYEGTLEGNYTLNAATLSGGNINYSPRTTYGSEHDFSTGYAYDHTLINDTMAIFDYEAIASAQFPNNPINDTTFGQQVFKNYYAYDDGTAEKAYGITGEQGLLAYKFNAYEADSLVAIQVHFVPTVLDVSNNLFLLTVWDDQNGQPGNVIYEDEFFFPRQPFYTYGRNKYRTYFFKDTMRVGVGETYYIGMRQIDEAPLNMGFDVNNDNSDKIFWSVDGGGNWNNSNFEGSIMMRPLVSSKLDYQLGLEKRTLSTPDFEFTLYPNPASSVLSIKGENFNHSTSFEMRDLNGRIVKRFNSKEQIDISMIHQGIYLVNRLEKGQVIQTKKLVVQ